MSKRRLDGVGVSIVEVICMGRGQLPCDLDMGIK